MKNEKIMTLHLAAANHIGLPLEPVIHLSEIKSGSFVGRL